MVNYKIICDTPKEVCCSRRVGRKKRTQTERKNLEDYYSQYVWQQWLDIEEKLEHEIDCEKKLEKMPERTSIRIQGAKTKVQMVNDAVAFLDDKMPPPFNLLSNSAS
jgi:uridine kinase